MRIALATYALNLGGIETFLLRLARCLAGRGHDVEIQQVESRGEWEGYFMGQGIRVKRILPGLLSAKTSHARAAAQYLAQFDAVAASDCPHVQSAFGLLPATTTAVSIVHGDVDSMYRNAVGNLAETDAIVGVGPRIVKRLVSEYAARSDLVSEITYGVEVPAEPPRDFAAGGPGVRLRVAFVGRLDNEQKGVFRIPGILSRLSSLWDGMAVSIVGEGADGPALKDRFKSECRGLDVVFKGRLTNEETREFLKTQHVLLLPSNYEGFPIVILEAMAAGVVPVASRLPDMTTAQIADGVTGFLRAPEDLDGFAEAIRRLMKPDRLAAMSEVAWREAVARFSVETMGRRYDELLGGLVAARRGGSLPPRSGRLVMPMLGDLPCLPSLLVRPARRAMKTIKLWRGDIGARTL